MAVDRALGECKTDCHIALRVLQGAADIAEWNEKAAFDSAKRH